MTDREWGLSPEEAVARIRAEIEPMRGTRELAGIDPDDAFILGMETVIHLFDKYTGENPVESGVVYYDDLPPAVRATLVDGEVVHAPVYDINVSEKKDDQ